VKFQVLSASHHTSTHRRYMNYSQHNFHRCTNTFKTMGGGGQEKKGRN
jgi:hypothetical protein